MELYLNGKPSWVPARTFQKPDPTSHAFKIAKGARTTSPPLKNGDVRDLKYWTGALPDLLFSDMVSGKLPANEFPPSDYSMKSVKTAYGIGGKGFAGNAVTLEISNPDNVQFREAWIQDLGKADHAAEIASLDHFALERGEKLYESLCITCHGTSKRRALCRLLSSFTPASSKTDRILGACSSADKGFGQMIPQPQYSIKDKYALIHYIRESLVKKNNPKQYFEVNEEYLALLPPKLSNFKETVVELPASGSKPYQKMDFGTALFWTYQVNKGRSPADWNIAQKGNCRPVRTRARRYFQGEITGSLR